MASAECCKRASMKIIQIAINVICIALLLKYDCPPNFFKISSAADLFKGQIIDYNRTYLAVAVAGGFLVISVLTLIAYVIEGMSKAPVLETLMMVVGAALSVVAGGLILDVWINHKTTEGETRDAGISFGSLQIVNGIVYLIDAFFVFKK